MAPCGGYGFGTHRGQPLRFQESGIVEGVFKISVVDVPESFMFWITEVSASHPYSRMGRTRVRGLEIL